MRELPILFNDEMVRAVLSGQKTQTRRPLKAQPNEVWSRPPVWVDQEGYYGCGIGPLLETRSDLRSPYLVGDRLYVRECFSPDYFGVGKPGFRAGWTDTDLSQEPKWHPSIHMPKALARIWLEVTVVRVERVQDISFNDATAEGVFEDFEPHGGHGFRSEARRLFFDIWDACYPGSWDRNDWVWVYEFSKTLDIAIELC